MSSESQYDTGYVFSGPHVAEHTKELANGLVLVRNHQPGVFVNENPASPWHYATFLAQGTTIRTAEGDTIGDVALLESTDADGDSAWAVIVWRYAEGLGTFTFVEGNGKWDGITGGGKTLGMVRDRADDHFMPRWEMNWAVDPKPRVLVDVAAMDAPDMAYDTGYVFSGPHIAKTSKVLGVGLVLEANYQNSVIVSENAASPWHHGTFLSHGTTIKTPEDKSLGDVAILEVTDADGDSTWVYIVDRYAEGPSNFHFIMGTGKWEGITGIGRTLGMVKKRADDHFMPRWEMCWKTS